MRLVRYDIGNCKASARVRGSKKPQKMAKKSEVGWRVEFRGAVKRRQIEPRTADCRLQIADCYSELTDIVCNSRNSYKLIWEIAIRNLQSTVKLSLSAAHKLRGRAGCALPI
jgi:hypothetical protein